MNNPLVSVCITTYNHEAYIAEALRSALAQQCPFMFEIVVGIDLSDDSTSKICRQFKDEYPDRIVLLEHEQRVGMHANYRLTIDSCRGKYIAFLDGDDFWTDNEKLSVQTAYLESHPNTAMCFSYSVRPHPDSKEEIHPSRYPTCCFADMLDKFEVENCTTLARRDKIMEYYNVIHPETHVSWLTCDIPMWLYMAAVYEIAFIPRRVAVHRIVEGSVSHAKDYCHIIRFWDSLFDIFLFYDIKFNSSKKRASILRRRQNNALWTLSHYGTNCEFIRRWFRDIIRYPSLVFNPAPIVLFLKKLLRYWRV